MPEPAHTSLAVRVAASTGCVLGENPLWNPVEQRLYWCDIHAGLVLRLDPATSTVQTVCDRSAGGQVVGGFTLESDGGLLLFMGGGLIERWKDGVAEMVLEPRPEMAKTRFNDVIADPRGRVFCGTMSAAGIAGGLYRLETDRSLTRVAENVGCSNGMGLSQDGKVFYYTDSFARTIWRFDFDAQSGSVENRRPFVISSEYDGLPDGMTVDGEDHVWSAHWDGGFVVRYSPEGNEVLRVAIPAKRPTSVAFGGGKMETLFITSAGGDARDRNGELSGSIFALEANVRGVAEFRSRIAMD